MALNPIFLYHLAGLKLDFQIEKPSIIHGVLDQNIFLQSSVSHSKFRPPSSHLDHQMYSCSFLANMDEASDHFHGSFCRDLYQLIQSHPFGSHRSPYQAKSSSYRRFFAATLDFSNLNQVVVPQRSVNNIVLFAHQISKLNQKKRTSNYWAHVHQQDHAKYNSLGKDYPYFFVPPQTIDAGQMYD